MWKKIVEMTSEGKSVSNKPVNLEYQVFLKSKMLVEKLNIVQLYKDTDLTGGVIDETRLAQLQEIVIMRGKGLISVKFSS